MYAKVRNPSCIIYRSIHQATSRREKPNEGEASTSVASEYGKEQNCYMTGHATMLWYHPSENRIRYLWLPSKR